MPDLNTLLGLPQAGAPAVDFNAIMGMLSNVQQASDAGTNVNVNVNAYAVTQRTAATGANAYPNPEMESQLDPSRDL